MLSVRCWGALLRGLSCRAWLVAALIAVTPTLHAQDVVVGQLASITNPATRTLAREYHSGIDLAFRHINAAGGVQGRRVVLTLKDDNFDPSLTVSLARELVEKEGAVALIGGLGTPTNMQLVREGFLTRNRIGNFAPFTGLPEVLAAEQVFPVRADFNDEVKAMLSHAASLGRKRVAYLYLRAGAGPALSELVAQWAGEAKVELVGNVGFANEADPDKRRAAIDLAVRELGSQPPDAVVLIAFGVAHSAAVTAIRRRYGAWLPVYSLGQVNLQDLLHQAGADSARGVSLTQVVPSPQSVDRRISREFSADRLRWVPGMPATYVALEGYVAGRVLGEILQRARPLSREGVLSAAHNAGELEVAGFRVLYRPTIRKSLYPVDVTIIDRDGRLLR